MTPLTLAAMILAHVALPPAQFDHAAATMIVKHMSITEVAERCRVHAKGVRDIVGCALIGKLAGKRVCLVIIPYKSSLGAEAYDRIRRHEQGHCNGWRHW